MFSTNFLISSSSGLGEVYGFVAVAETGSGIQNLGSDVVTVSSDGINWQTRNLEGAANVGTFLTSVAWSDSLQLWVILGSNRPSFPGSYQKIWTSTDAITWTARDYPTSPSYQLAGQAVIWSSDLGKFLGTGGNSSSTGFSYITSTDGITWTSAGQSLDQVGIAYSPSLGKAQSVQNSGNYGYHSSNLSSWSVVTGDVNNNRGVIWIAELGAFISVGLNFAGYSTNGTSTSRVNTPDGAEYSSLAWSPTLSRIVAVGRTGSVRAMYSSDGTSWSNTSVTGASSYSWNSVTWSPFANLFVAVGNGGITMSSSDGISWTTSQSSLSTTATSIRNLRGVNWGLIPA